MSFKSWLGYWRMLKVPDQDLDNVTGLRYNHILDIGSLSWVWRCKEHPCTFNPYYYFGGFLRLLIGILHMDHDWNMSTYLWFTSVPKFSSLSWFWRCKDHQYPYCPDCRLWGILWVPDWGLASLAGFGYSNWFWVHPCSKFWLFILILKVQRTKMSLKSLFWAFEDFRGSWLVLASSNSFEYSYWSLIHKCSKFRLSTLILKVQRTSISFKSWFGFLKDAGGSWLGFGILILHWIWSLVIGTQIIQN